MFIGFGATLKVGGGRIMRVKRVRGCALRTRRGMLPPTDNFLRMALPALVLRVLLAVCCYFGNLGNALLCESYKLYKLEAVVQNDAPPLPPWAKKWGAGSPPAPPAPKPMMLHEKTLQVCLTYIGVKQQTEKRRAFGGVAKKVQ